MYAGDYDDAVSYSYPVGYDTVGPVSTFSFVVAGSSWTCAPAANHGLWVYCNYVPGSLLICPSQTLMYDNNWVTMRATLKNWKGGVSAISSGRRRLRTGSRSKTVSG